MEKYEGVADAHNETSSVRKSTLAALNHTRSFFALAAGATGDTIYVTGGLIDGKGSSKSKSALAFHTKDNSFV